MKFLVTEREARFTVGPYVFMGALVSVLALPLLAISMVHVLGFLGVMSEKGEHQTGWGLFIFFLVLGSAILNVYGRILSRSVFSFNRISGEFTFKRWSWGRTRTQIVPKDQIAHLEVLEHGNPLSHGPYLKIELQRKDGHPIVFHHQIPYIAPFEIKEAKEFLDATGVLIHKTIRHDKNRIDRALEKVGRTT